MKKLLSLISIMLIVALSLTACNSKTKVETVGSVNGEKITKQEYEYVFEGICEQMLSQASSADASENFWDTELEGQKAIDVARERTINQIAQMMVARQKAKEFKITLNDEDKQLIENAKQQFITQVGGQEAYQEYLTTYKIDEAYHDEILDRQIYTQKLMEHLGETDEAFKADEDAIKQQIKSSKVMAKHILFSTVDATTQQPLPEADVAKALKDAQDTLAAIKGGADFDTLMKEKSQDPGLAQAPNGYLFGQGEMVAPFEEAAFALADNQVSEIVKTDFGYHIIKKVPFDEISADFQNAVLTEKQTVWSQALTPYLEDLVSKAKIEKDEEKINAINPPSPEAPTQVPSGDQSAVPNTDQTPQQ